MLKLLILILFTLPTFAQSPFWKMEGFFEGDTQPPSVATSLSAVGDINKVTLTWTDPTESDFDSVRIYAGTTTNPTTWVASVAKGVQSYKDSNYSYNTIRHYRIKSKDQSGNLSAYTSSVNDTVNMWLGSELILNGTFSSTSNWTILGANSSISGGTANLVSISAGYTEIYQSIVCSTQYSYYFSVQAIVNSGTGVVYYHTEMANPLTPSISTSGTYTKVWSPSSLNNSFVSMKRTASCNINFDNLSIKRILNP